jgi:ferrous iron transport protein B
MYFMGIVIIFFCALIVKLITCYKNKKSYFIMELPEYKLPSLKKAVISMGQRGWSFIVKAGTVILVCNFVVHVMQNFNWKFQVIEEGMASTSILATIASPFAYLLAPIFGVVAWQLAAASITGFIAKENVVGTLAVCYGISNFFDLDELAMIEGAGANVAAVLGISKIAALAFLMFNLFTPPCFAAIGAMNAELKSKKWFFGAIGLQLAVGYSIGFIVNFFGTVFSSTSSFDSIWMPILGWSIVALSVGTIAFIAVRNQKRFKAEEQLKKSQKKETVTV